MSVTLETIRNRDVVLVVGPAWALGVAVSPRSEDAAHMNPETALPVMDSNHHLLAVVDGPMFEECGSRGGYANTDCESLNYLVFDPKANANAPSKHPGDGCIIGFDGEGVGFARRGGVKLPTDKVAIQGFPTLVFDGHVVASNTGSNSEQNWRAALVLMNDGRIALAATARRLDMVAFAQALVAAGAKAATYTDGGGSTALRARDGGLLTGSAENRRVASFVALYDSDRYGTQGSILRWVALAVLGLAVGAAVGALTDAGDAEAA